MYKKQFNHQCAFGLQCNFMCWLVLFLCASNLFAWSTGPKKNLSLAKSMAGGNPDTLEIFVLYTQFKEEPASDDITTTTGLGTFDSYKDSKSTLDPVGARKHRYYLDKHMEFARHYFETISNGRFSIDWKIFPTPNSTNGIIEPYQLSQNIPYYNPSRKDKEKGTVFNKRKAQSLMKFIAETLRKADAASENPFSVPKSTSPNRKRAYLIFHAGHNGMVDGGHLGQLGANTPNDFIDFFATGGDFELLDSLPKETNPLLAQQMDSMGVVVGPASLKDTIREVMTLSESASQDGVNFGINGILVNQIARQIGMPDTWDRGTGFTQLGYYDMMDVGHLSMLGHVPNFPSAWLRIYMGWDDAITASPNDKGIFESKLWAPQLVGQNHIVKVPLNSKEYLLIENRQKTIGDSLTVWFSYPQNKDDVQFLDSGSIAIHVSAIDSLLLDSICATNKKCVVNPKKPKGIITKMSSYEAGLPGSGLVVWHVNEWFIEEAIRYGAVNVSDKDTKQFLGLALVEADGDMTMGIEGKDATGQSFFDFGEPSDAIPHIKKRLKMVNGDSTWKVDTLRYIHPYGLANTSAWNDARSGLILEAVFPDSAKFRREKNAITGDSIRNFADSALMLRVHYRELVAVKKPINSKWPLQGLPAPHQPSILVLPSDSGTLIDVSGRGDVELFNMSGNPVLSLSDSVRLDRHYDSLLTLLPTALHRDSLLVSIHSLGSAIGEIDDLVGVSDTAFVARTRSGKAILYSPWSSDSLGRIKDLGAEYTSGLIVYSNKIYLMSDTSVVIFNSDGTLDKTFSGPGRTVTNWAILAKNGDLVAVDEKGALFHLDTEKNQGRWVVASLSNTAQDFSVVASDFNRNEHPDVWVLGSSGMMNLVEFKDGQWDTLPGFPRIAARLVAGQNPRDKKFNSPPAVGDLNSDGYPDILFAVSNGLTAMDYRGNPISGWPFIFNATQPLGLASSDTTMAAGIVGSNPIISKWDNEPVVFCATPDGYIEAINGRGQLVNTTSFDSTLEYARYSSRPSLQLRDFPLTMSSISYGTSNVFTQLALAKVKEGNILIAKDEKGYRDAWVLSKADVSATSWPVWGGSNGRTYFYATDSLNQVVATAPTSKIIEFHLYPAPLKEDIATIHLNLGDKASKLRLRVFNLAGRVVREESYTDFPYAGVSRDRHIDMGMLGANVYSVLAEVWFADGKKDSKWFRIGVIR